jgi:hypothetical protein
MDAEISGQVALDILVDVFGHPVKLEQKAAAAVCLTSRAYYGAQASVLRALEKVVGTYRRVAEGDRPAYLPATFTNQWPEHLSAEELLTFHGGEAPTPPLEDC